MSLLEQTALLLWCYTEPLGLALIAHLLVCLWQMGKALIRNGDPFALVFYGGRAAQCLAALILVELVNIGLTAVAYQ